MLQNKTTEQDRKVHTLHKHYTKYTLHKHSHMRRSDHPSGFSSFDPKTFSFAKLIIAYHHKCDKMVIIVKDTTNSNSHVRLDCSHHLPTISTTTTAHTLKHLPQCLDKLHSSLNWRLQTTPFMNTSVVAWCAGAPSVNLLLN
jgi:hypothetical protein